MVEELKTFFEKVKNDFRNPDLDEPNFEFTMQMLPKFKKTMKNIVKDVSLTLEVVDTILELLNNLLNESKLKTKEKYMSSILVFLLLSSEISSAEEFTRAMVKKMQRFFDLTAGLPRTVLFSKGAPLCKVLKYLGKRVQQSKTYITQEKIVELLVRIMEDVGESSIAAIKDQIHFHRKDKVNTAIKTDLFAIKSENFRQSCRIFLNRLNGFVEQRCDIFSVQGKLKRINNIQLADDQIEKVWIDFHAACLTFTFSSAFICFSLDSGSREMYHVEIEAYDGFAAGNVVPNKSFELIVRPLAYKILDSAEKEVKNIQITDILLELEDEGIKIEAFEKTIFEMFQNRTKLPKRAESTSCFADNDSLFSFGTFKTSMTPASRVVNKQFGTGSSIAMKSVGRNNPLLTHSLKGQVRETPMRNNNENEEPKNTQVAENEKKDSTIQEASASQDKRPSKPEKPITIQNVLRELRDQELNSQQKIPDAPKETAKFQENPPQGHQSTGNEKLPRISDESKKDIENGRKNQTDLEKTNKKFPKDLPEMEAPADPRKPSTHVKNNIEVIDLISQDLFEDHIDRKSEDLFSTTTHIFTKSKTQPTTISKTTDADATLTKSREINKKLVKQEKMDEISEKIVEDSRESRDDPEDARNIPTSSRVPREIIRKSREICETPENARGFQEIGESSGQIGADRGTSGVTRQIGAGNQRELRVILEKNNISQDLTKKKTQNQEKIPARRSVRRPVKFDEYSFDDTDDDLDIRPYRSKRSIGDKEEDEVPSKRQKKTEDIPKTRQARKKKNSDEEDELFMPPTRLARPIRGRKQTKTQTKNQKVEKVGANGKKSVTMVKSSKKSTVKTGKYTDLSSLDSDRETGGKNKRNTINYRRQSVTKVQYEIEEFDDDEQTGNVKPLTGSSRQTGGIKNAPQNSAKLRKVSGSLSNSKRVPSTTLEKATKPGRIVGIPKNLQNSGQIPKIDARIPGLRQSCTKEPRTSTNTTAPGIQAQQGARKRPTIDAPEDWDVPGPSGYHPPQKVPRTAANHNGTARKGINKTCDAFEELMKDEPPRRYTNLFTEKVSFKEIEKKYADKERSNQIPKQTFVVSSTTPDITYNYTALTENPLMRKFLDNVATQNPVKETANDGQYEENGSEKFDQEVPENQVMEADPEIHASPQHTYTIQKANRTDVKAPIEPTKNARFSEKIAIVSPENDLMEIEQENPPELHDTTQHTYTIERSNRTEVKAPVENVRFTEKIAIVPGKMGNTIQYEKTAKYSSEESGVEMIKEFKYAEQQQIEGFGGGFSASAADQMKDDLNDSYLRILEEKEEKLKSIEMSPEQFHIARVQEQMKNYLSLNKDLNNEVPVFVELMKQVQAQRQKIVVMQEKQSVILNDLLKMKMENLEVLNTTARKFNNAIDDSIQDGQIALEKAKKEIWKKYMDQVFQQLGKETASFYDI